jgi:light-harvesting complex 1 beta chain
MAAVALIAVNAPLAVSCAEERQSFRLIFVTAFVFLLAIVLVAEALRLRWRPWFPGAESERSLIGGVRAAVRCFIPLLV